MDEAVRHVVVVCARELPEPIGRNAEAIDALASTSSHTVAPIPDRQGEGSGRTLHTTHQTIANDLHTSRVVVSRLLKRFEHEGKLTLHRNAVEMKGF